MSTRTRTGARKVLETTRTGRWARESLAKERPPPRGAPGPFPLFSFIKGRRSSGGNPSAGTQKYMFSHHFANGCRALHTQETPGNPRKPLGNPAGNLVRTIENPAPPEPEILLSSQFRTRYGPRNRLQPSGSNVRRNPHLSDSER